MPAAESADAALVLLPSLEPPLALLVETGDDEAVVAEPLPVLLNVRAAPVDALEDVPAAAELPAGEVLPVSRTRIWNQQTK